MMKMLDLFSGSKSVSNVFKEYGWDILTLDFNPKLNPDICINILDFNIDMLNGFKPNFIWASPDCSTFSVASIGTHWTGGSKAYIPKTEKCINALKCLEKTVMILDQVKPQFFCIENPRNVMRKMECIQKYKRDTVWYCQYGWKYAKPTDLWNNLENFKPKICKNGNKDHVPSPRGSQESTQGIKGGYFERSKIPPKLIEEIILSLRRKNNVRMD